MCDVLFVEECNTFDQFLAQSYGNLWEGLVKVGDFMQCCFIGEDYD